MRRFVIFGAVLWLACTKKSASQETCKVTSDCQAGLFCVGSACKANLGSGGACSSASDCKPQEACAGGKCGQFGCDSAHPCNDGCCSAGQCAAIDACGGGVTCSSDGTCPARCDAASGGNGCNSGCCDGNGACVDGTADNACGSGASCADCGKGAACSGQTCVCASCSGDTVCSGAGCADCSTHPCGGVTPFCDGGTTHACQPCGMAGPGFCPSATPYCNSTGACAGTPDSSAACASYDPTNPVLVSAGVCGCTAATICPNNFACDATSHCVTSCEPNSSTGCVSASFFCTATGDACSAQQANGTACNDNNDCASGHCDCAAADCSTRVCTSGCAECTYASAAGDCSAGFVAPGATAFNCNASVGDCANALPCACDGTGVCKSGQGHSCAALSSADATCATAACNYSDHAEVAALVCGESYCGFCGYSPGGGACQTQPDKATPPSCGAGFECNASGDCLRASGTACTSDAQCYDGHCDYNDFVATTKVCSPIACTSCKYLVGATCTPRKKNLPCTEAGACSEPKICDNIGQCACPGSCDSDCERGASDCGGTVTSSAACAGSLGAGEGTVASASCEDKSATLLCGDNGHICANCVAKCQCIYF